MRAAWLALLVLGLTGCGNPCQQVCARMASYARECGHQVTPSEVAACVDEQADAPRDDFPTCRQDGTRAGIRALWTCDDVDAYFARTVAPQREEGADT